MAKLQENTPYDDVFKTQKIECQSTKDTSISIRMYEYDSQIALKDREWDGKKLKVKFPYSTIIYLRSDDTMGEDIGITLNTSEDEAEYQIPLIKLKNYTLDMIFEKHLFILLPFWIFTYEDRLKAYEENDNQRKKLTDDFRIIIRRLQENCEKGILDEYTKCMIMDMSKKVVRNLLGDKFPKVRREVETMMGGKVLDFEAKRIKDEGREEGREEGLSTLVNSLKKFLKDLEEIYNIVTENELYKNVTREQVEKYYYAK